MSDSRGLCHFGKRRTLCGFTSEETVVQLAVRRWPSGHWTLAIVPYLSGRSVYLKNKVARSLLGPTVIEGVIAERRAR